MTYVSPAYTYLLVFADDFGNPVAVRQTLDLCPEVLFWYRCLPNAFFLVSQYASQQIARRLHTLRPQGRFLVLDTATDRAGWLPKDAWKLMKDPGSFGPG